MIKILQNFRKQNLNNQITHVNYFNYLTITLVEYTKCTYQNHATPIKQLIENVIKSLAKKPKNKKQTQSTPAPKHDTTQPRPRVVNKSVCEEGALKSI